MSASCGPNELLAGAAALTQTKAEDYVNKPELEIEWAMKAYQHAETYFNLLLAIDPKLLKLTKCDDEIFKHFKEVFPDTAVDKIDEDAMKSSEGKELWRPFCEFYREKVQDYNMGTLIRLDCTEDYSEKNSTIVPRIQFFAIEIARNRGGHNSGLAEKFKKSKS